MQLVQGGCFQPDCAAPLGRRRMAQKPSPAFLAAAFGAACVPSSAGPNNRRICPKADARLRTEEAAYRTCPYCGPVPAGDRRREATSAAPGLPSESGRRSRSGGDGSACRHASGFVGFRRILPGGRKVLRKIRRAGGFAAFCLAGVKGLLLFRCVPAARVPGSLSADTARQQKRQLAVAPETAQKNQSAPWLQKGAAPCHTGLLCAAWVAIRAVARGVRRRKAVSGQKKSTFLKKGKYLSVFS